MIPCGVTLPGPYNPSIPSPIIHPPPDKTTEHRPYLSACRHQPVSPFPLDHYREYIHSPKWHFSHWLMLFHCPHLGLQMPIKTPILHLETCPPFLLSEPLMVTVWWESGQTQELRIGGSQSVQLPVPRHRQTHSALSTQQNLLPSAPSCTQQPKSPAS